MPPKSMSKFSGFKHGPDGAEMVYSGPGVAYFSHYNDGRWILTRVEASGRAWNGLDLEADCY